MQSVDIGDAQRGVVGREPDIIVPSASLKR
jgi:hypothetical protein